jgi:hypothetical protein
MCIWNLCWTESSAGLLKVCVFLLFDSSFLTAAESRVLQPELGWCQDERFNLPGGRFAGRTLAIWKT